MFTGIVQAVGQILSVEQRLSIKVPSIPEWEPWVLGESVAVDGCCLTVVSADDGTLGFDVSEETARRTTFGQFKPGDQVNLERAMRPSDRFGGHIVQGHVDTAGELISIQPTGQAPVYRFRVDASMDRYLIDKGSIAINGISLTVVSPRGGEFDVAIIPHTLSATNLQDLSVGGKVNIEFDVIAKHVEKLLTMTR